MKTYTGWLTNLPENSIFVFGSNTKGISMSGNAAAAVRYFGAQQGVSQGYTGQSYAICTTELGGPIFPMEKIIAQIGALYLHAAQTPEKEFYIAYSADGQYRSGYDLKELAYMFSFYTVPENIIFEKGFYAEIKHQQALNTEL